MPQGKSIIRPRSHCPRCGHVLGVFENIPIFSFIFLRGRCRVCREKISFLYPTVELLCALLSIAAWYAFGEPIRYLIFLCLFIIPLVIVSFIDIFHMIIPDSISIGGIFVGIAVYIGLNYKIGLLSAIMDSVGGALAGGAVLFIIAFAYEKLRKAEGLGGGDVKLIAMLGAFLGIKSVIPILLFSSILGSLVGIVFILIYRKDTKTAIPYGPFLAASGLLYLFFGNSFLSWYLGLIHKSI
jgi:leader peptidase (prepilin peptidase)/N-methyltransferase